MDSHSTLTKVTLLITLHHLFLSNLNSIISSNKNRPNALKNHLHKNKDKHKPIHNKTNPTLINCYTNVCVQEIWMKLSEKTISLQTIPFFVLQSNVNVSLPLSYGVHPTLVRQLLPKVLLTQQIPLSIALSLYLPLLVALKTLEMLLKTPKNSDAEQTKPLFSLLMKFIGLINRSHKLL
ncbi:hypothetical protein MtrunA17_Chr6g0464081 [Medicago truncatula]|uniref:Transmembrane protein n=1 Tax=Medicago truncatula TaxID=3880 RepID=A0A396HEK1_MEDTR|nr:hypothetical protein MtrunA17_Chr6g0464081 [Medicago truncatula]